MWRAEPVWLLAVGARQVEGAIWSGRRRDEPSDRCCVPIARASHDDAGDRVALDAVHEALTHLTHQLQVAQGTMPRGPNGTVQVAVSARWITLTTLAWSDALADTALRDSHLRSELADAGASVETDDCMLFDDQCRHGQPCAVAIYPAALMRALRATASTLGARLDCVQPLAHGALAAATRKDGQSRLAVVEPDHLQFVALEQGSLRFGPTIDEPALAGGGSDAVLRLWQRQQLRGGEFASVLPLQVADLRTQHEALPHRKGPDEASVLAPVVLTSNGSATSPALGCAMRLLPGASLDATGVQRTARWVWIAAAVMLVVAFALALEAARVQAARPVTRSAADSTTTPPSAAPTRAQIDRVRSVNAAIRELNLPVTPMLEALLPPRGSGVALVALDIEPARTDAAPPRTSAAGIRITAVAPNAAAMARYVDTLNERQPRSAARLLQHQFDENDAAQQLRFTVQWSWLE